MYDINEILLRRKHKIIIDTNKSNSSKPFTTCFIDDNDGMIITIMKNIEAYGFTFDQKLFEALRTYDASEIKSFYFDLIEEIKPLVGADKEYFPMYPNFPEQVVEASDVELFVNAIMHYWSYGTIKPQYHIANRLPLFDNPILKVLSVGTEEDLVEIFVNLVSSKTSLSVQDKDDIATLIKDMRYLERLPDEIPSKENLVIVSKLVIDNVPDLLMAKAMIKAHFRTATDVLRLIVALSDGDVSLTQPTKFKHLSRKERRLIMDLLANCGNILEDLYRYQYEWIRVGEIIHPGTYDQSKYLDVVDAFRALRNHTKPLFISGQIAEAIKGKDALTVIKSLQSRPGDFARALDKILRDTPDDNKFYVINSFKEVASKVSTPVLLQVRQHFKDRNNGEPVRIVFPKGNTAKAWAISNDVPYIGNDYCEAIVSICSYALIDKFKSKEYLGKVYIDEDLKNYTIPFSQRSASSGNKQLSRGSHVKMKDDAKCVRAFIWWTNTEQQRVDIDLSAAIYDENWNHITHVSYTNLRSTEMKSYHSGDITNGGDVNGKGVAEFLDVDIDSVAKNARYICYQVFSYTRQKFNTLPNCRFGWMQRDDVNSGEIFEPSTVDMLISLNSNSDIAIPVIFDCQKREFIWCDLTNALPNQDRWMRLMQWNSNNLESNLRGTTATCYAMTHFSKPDLYTLISLNAYARGIVVADRADADIIFSNDTTQPTYAEITDDGKMHVEIKRDKTIPIITAYDVDYIVGKLL